jgi:TPR repeat protein
VWGGLLTFVVFVNASASDAIQNSAEALYACHGEKAVRIAEPTMPLPMRKAIEKRIAKAIKQVHSLNQTAEGIGTLEKLGKSGSGAANYWLGRIYMEGIGVNQDTNAAVHFFRKVQGDFQISATILSAVIYARGSANSPPDLPRAEQIFKEIDHCIKEGSQTHVGRPASEDEMRRRLQWHETSVMLYGYARELGIVLDAPMEMR